MRALPLLFCSSLSLLLSPLASAESLSIGRSESILLLDGRCEAAEWRHAARHAVTDRIALRLQQDARYLYLCVTSPEDSMNTLDIYLQAADRPELMNLHASAQVGQRVRSDAGWPEYQWWNHDGWYSPAVPFTGMQRDGERTQARFKPGVAREVQIDKARFGAYPWRVMFQIGGERDAEGHWINRSFPADASEDDPSGWLMLGAAD